MSAVERVAELAATFGAEDANVALLLCDRHPADNVAFTVVDAAGEASTLTFGQLAADSHRYAQALRGLGVGPGDRVASLMGKSTELVTLLRCRRRRHHAHVNRYHGRVVAITGGAQGLGLAIAARFASEGAVVALADLNGQALADSAETITHDAKVRTDVVDMTDSAQVNAWIAAVVEDFGRLDVLVNNAGIIRHNRVEYITDDDWHAVLDVSLTGSFHCARTASTPMKHQGYGRIMSFSSMSWRGNFGQGNYVAAKAEITASPPTPSPPASSKPPCSPP